MNYAFRHLVTFLEANDDGETGAVSTQFEANQPSGLVCAPLN